MKIMVRRTGTRWEKVEDKTFAKEAELQRLLVDNPDLIPVELVEADRKPISVAIPEAGLPGSGKTDLIGVDEDGNIVIVETGAWPSAVRARAQVLPRRRGRDRPAATLWRLRASCHPVRVPALG
jgi:RecB family endonuclease NucS